MAEVTKRCFKCGQVKPISEFYVHSQMADGHLNKCKECTRRDVRMREEQNPEAVLQSRMKSCEKKPSHKNAYRAVDAALKCGVLVKPERCSICGCDGSVRRIEAHHYDYRKPLSVVWLCSMCHDKADQLRREQEGLPATSAAKAVVMSRNGEVLCRFDSITDASRAVGVMPNTISACLTGASKTAGGVNWSYETEEG